MDGCDNTGSACARCVTLAAAVAERDGTIRELSATLERVTARLKWEGLDDNALTVSAGYEVYERARRHDPAWDGYRRRLEPLVRRLGSLPCLQLGPEAWADHLNARREEKVGRWRDRLPSPTTLDQELTIARMMLTWLVRAGKLPRNPLEAAAKIGEPARRETCPSEANVEQLLASADMLAIDGRGHRDDRRVLLFRAFYTTKARTGCRFDEVLQLRRDWIAPDGLVRIPRRHTKARKKRTPRVVKLPPDALAAVRAVPQLGADPRVFTVQRGDGITLVTDETMRQWFYRVAERTGVAACAAEGEKLVPHTLRHAFATQAEARGARPRAIQSSLDHASFSTTEIYLHADGEAAARSIADLMGGRHGPRRAASESTGAENNTCHVSTR